MSKQAIKSFKIDNGKAVKPVIRKALERLKEIKDIEASRENRTHSFYYEIIDTFENIRVNCYSVTDKDMFELGILYQQACNGTL